MDELIVLLVRWIARMISDRSNAPGTTGRGTPALPPAWSGGGPAPSAPAPAAARPPVRRSPPALRQPKVVRRTQVTTPDVLLKMQPIVPVKPAATAVTHTGITRLRSSFTSESIRKQWILYELLQPPLSLRE